MSRGKKTAADLSPADLEKEIEKGRIELLYLFLGTEIYLKELALKQLAGTVDEAFRAFNITYFSLQDTPLAVALDTARQLPMMSRRRLVVISDLDKIKDEADVDALIDYLQHPVDTTCLVFVGAALDGRRRYAASLQKTCLVVSFEPPGEREAGAWADKYLRARGVQIEPSALGLLIGLTGCNLLQITTELEKLITYAGRAKRITPPDIEALVPRTRQHTNFELGDALMNQDRKKALRLLRRIVADGSEPVAIVGMLGWAYRRMLIAKELMQRNAPMSEVAKEAKVSPYAHDFFTQVRRMELAKILFGIKRIAEVDLAIKTSAGTPRLQLEHLICELTSPTPFK